MDEFIDDEALTRELAEDKELRNAIPHGILVSYEQLGRCSRTVRIRIEHLMLLLFSADMADDLGFDVNEYVSVEVAGIKESVVRRQMVTDEIADWIGFIEDVIEMRRSDEQDDKAAQMLEMFKQHGLHGMYNQAMGPLAPMSPRKGCVICMADNPCGKDVAPTCQHPPCLCHDCFAAVDTCPLCRATAPGSAAAADPPAAAADAAAAAPPPPE